jgi:DNA polymerase
MSASYNELLQATIQHLEHLKSEGARYVSVSPATLTALAIPAALHQRGATLPKTTAAPTAAPLPVRTERPLPPATSKPIESPATTLSADPKVEAMAELRRRALACVKCSHLVATRKSVVFGVGDINSPLMFVGEAPGADEDTRGEPFVGRAGQLLTRIIVAMGLARETVYIANILKCRPDTPNQPTGNRKPTPEEMQTCIPYLHEQIDLIQPKVIVALGGTAIEGLLGKTSGITRLRGQWQTYRGIALMPTYHPSFLLRPENGGKKRDVWEDMLQVMDKLTLPISEKQRNYFLKSAD